MRKINTLIVEDHPIVSEGYQIAFDVYGSTNNIDFNIDVATTLGEAHSKLRSNTELFLLDLQLPIDKEHGLLNGEDLALKIKTIFKNSIIIIITMYDDAIRINNIVSDIDPAGIIHKSDMTAKLFSKVMDTVFAGKKYYSSSISRKVNRISSNDYNLSKKERELLYYIYNGVKTKDLPDKLMLSLSTIERKKKKLSEVFGGKGSDDQLLRKMAKELGYV